MSIETSNQSSQVLELVDHVYKTDSAKLLAVLTRILGVHNLELAEDVLQEAFGKALQYWESDLPENPSAWVLQVAKNLAIDTIRKNKSKIQFSQDLAIQLESEWSMSAVVEQEFQEDNIKDDMLRMIFMCCHKKLKDENRIPFILKTLCGFSISAVSRAMLLPEATIKKRLARTRKQLQGMTLSLPDQSNAYEIMETVHLVLYLLFNEGFHSSHKDRGIHLIFCQEAIGLMQILIDEPKYINAETLALFALMHFHIARIESRFDNNGQNIPIDLQDRSLWRIEYIRTADYFLQQAMRVSKTGQGRFLAEALIMREHCQAENFAATKWSNIVEHYQMLIVVTQSPLAELNQAIALAYSGEVDVALENALNLQRHPKLKSSHIPEAVLAHLYAIQGQHEKALASAEASKQAGGTTSEHLMMMQQIERLLLK